MPARPADAFTDHALDLFAGLPVPVSARRMFGGVGFYAGGLFFAIGDPGEGRLWLKVDDQCRAAFEAAGGVPFTYAMPKREVVAMAYLTPPDGALDDAEAMRPWAALAVEAARRAAAARAAKAVRPARRAAGGSGPAKGRPATGARAGGRRGARRGRS